MNGAEHAPHAGARPWSGGRALAPLSPRGHLGTDEPLLCRECGEALTPQGDPPFASALGPWRREPLARSTSCAGDAGTGTGRGFFHGR